MVSRSSPLGVLEEKVLAEHFRNCAHLKKPFILFFGGQFQVKDVFRSVPLFRLFLRNYWIADDVLCIKVELI